MTTTTTIEKLNARSQGTLLGLIGIEFTGLEPGRATSRPDASDEPFTLLAQQISTPLDIKGPSKKSIHAPGANLPNP